MFIKSSFSIQSIKHLLFFISVFYVQISAGQNDDPNCRDNSILGRMPNTYIALCSTGEEMIVVSTSDSTSELASGKRFFARYEFETNKSLPVPAFKDVVSYFESVVLKNGGRKIYTDSSSESASMLIPGKVKNLWIVLNYQSAGSYELITVEADANKKITALSILDDLSTKGSSTLYLKFDNKENETLISRESAGIIDIITDLLQTETDLQISIEGHTDNKGSVEAGQKLSEDRAKCVYDAIVTKGVEKKRLKFKGWGQTKPLFENSTEEGRDKNNRIELVKI